MIVNERQTLITVTATQDTTNIGNRLTPLQINLRTRTKVVNVSEQWIASHKSIAFVSDAAHKSVNIYTANDSGGSHQR